MAPSSAPGLPCTAKPEGIDKLQVEMQAPTEPDPNAAAAVQELLGGLFGEMSTLINYMINRSTSATATICVGTTR
jgi:Mn-containing catalase